RVVQHHADTGLLRRIRATAVPEAADVQHRRAGRHRHRPRLGAGPRAFVDPAVTPGHDAGRTVLFGEVVERPHDVDDELRVRTRERIDRVVGVQRLRTLAGTDLDRGRR